MQIKGLDRSLVARINKNLTHTSFWVKLFNGRFKQYLDVDKDPRIHPWCIMRRLSAHEADVASRHRSLKEVEIQLIEWGVYEGAG